MIDDDSLVRNGRGSGIKPYDEDVDGRGDECREEDSKNGRGNGGASRIQTETCS
jgi:hypothetical protein